MFLRKRYTKDKIRRDFLKQEVQSLRQFLKGQYKRYHELKDDRNRMINSINYDKDRFNAIQAKVREINALLNKSDTPKSTNTRSKTSSHLEESQSEEDVPNVLTPRCVKCDDYARYPKKLLCFHCLKKSLDPRKCRTINETGPNIGLQCGYTPSGENGRCIKHNEEYIDVVRSSDEDESSGNEEINDSIVVVDHSSDGSYVESSEEACSTDED